MGSGKRDSWIRRACLTSRRITPKPLAIAADRNLRRQCHIRNAQTPSPGRRPRGEATISIASRGESIVGEVMLQELEDDEETRTQLFFKSDGTIGHGSTDGPPPAGFCGLWQCGEKQFQMTLSRAFSSPSATLSPEQQGGMESDIAYTVVRVYEGTVDAESKGVALLNGRIDLLSDSDVAAWAGSDASSIAALDPFDIDVPPVGYFVIDAGTSYDQETGDGATARSNLKA